METRTHKKEDTIKAVQPCIYCASAPAFHLTPVGVLSWGFSFSFLFCLRLFPFQQSIFYNLQSELYTLPATIRLTPHAGSPVPEPAAMPMETQPTKLPNMPPRLGLVGTRAVYCAIAGICRTVSCARCG